MDMADLTTQGDGVHFSLKKILSRQADEFSSIFNYCVYEKKRGTRKMKRNEMSKRWMKYVNVKIISNLMKKFFCGLETLSQWFPQQMCN